MSDTPVSPSPAALQRGPRPLPLFLAMLREQTAATADRGRAALAGLSAYQNAPREPPPAPALVVDRQDRATLLSIGSDVAQTPVVFVPSLINPSSILDLTEDTSLMRGLAARGLRTLMVDWGSPDTAARNMDLAAHVEQLLAPLLRRLTKPPVIVGYCLGGTLAIGAASLLPMTGLALIATPWHFDGFPRGARAEIATLWTQAKPACEAMGMVPMEVLQSGFWRLDPARTIAKYVAFGGMVPGSDAARRFVAIEDWANAGAPMPYAAGRELFEDFVARNVTGDGRWRIGGAPVNPHRLDCPTVEFVSRADRIVPAASAAGLADSRILSAGHVGMIVGSQARAQLWEPLADWLCGVAFPK